MAERDSRNTEQADESWVSRALLERVRRKLQQRRTEKYHESAVDRAGRSTARATWAIAVLTVVAIGVGVSQFLILRGQLDEMRATREGSDKATADQLKLLSDQTKAMQGQLSQMQVAQRAWLLVDELSVEQIQIFPVGVGINALARYNVRNIGHSPANHIRITTRLLLDSDNFDDVIGHEICRTEEMEENPSITPLIEHYSRILMPGQVQTIKGFGVNAASFRRSIDDIDTNRQLKATLIFAGCISYKLLGDDALHETGFAFEVGADVGDMHFQDSIFPGLTESLKIDIGKKGVIKIPPLRVSYMLIGNFAN